MSDHRLPGPSSTAASTLANAGAAPTRDPVHVGYIEIPKLDRLMGLRDALVAFQGPLANEPGLRENLRKLLFNEETCDRVLGKIRPLSLD